MYEMVPIFSWIYPPQSFVYQGIPEITPIKSGGCQKKENSLVCNHADTDFPDIGRNNYSNPL